MAREKVKVAFQLAIMLAVLLAFQPLPVHAAATLIQQNSAGCYGGGCIGTPPIVVSFLSSLASGNVIVLGVVVNDGTVNSVSDSKGSTFAQAVSATARWPYVYIYVATLSSSGSDTVTVTFFGVTPVSDPLEEVVYIYEVSGVTTTGAGTGTGSGEGTSMSTSAVAFLSGAFLLGIVGTGFGAGCVAGAGFTLSPAPSGTGFSHAEYATSGVSSPTTFPATAVPNNWVEVGVALNPAPVLVGGKIVSVNQSLVALPWLALVAVLGVAVVGAYAVGQRKRK